jgi:hypothetical protein
VFTELLPGNVLIKSNTIFNTDCVSMLKNYLCRKFYVPKYSGSLVIIMKPKSKENFRTKNVLFKTSKNTTDKSCTFLVGPLSCSNSEPNRKYYSYCRAPHFAIPACCCYWLYKIKNTALRWFHVPNAHTKNSDDRSEDCEVGMGWQKHIQTARWSHIYHFLLSIMKIKLKWLETLLRNFELI